MMSLGRGSSRSASPFGPKPSPLRPCYRRPRRSSSTSGVRVTTVGRDGYFASLERDGNGPYTVTALVPDPDSPDGPTDASLRGAGTDYPADVIALYTAEVPGMFGPNLRALRDEVVRTSSSPAPYDVAQRLVEVLHSDTYHYDTDVRDVDCGTMSTPECFATSKRGYCMHYATTMAVIIRDLGIPARVVQGFLPGERIGRSAIETLTNRWRPRLGRGLLPGLRVGRVRSDGGRRRGLVGCAAACPADFRSEPAGRGRPCRGSLR